MRAGEEKGVGRWATGLRGRRTLRMRVEQLRVKRQRDEGLSTEATERLRACNADGQIG